MSGALGMPIRAILRFMLIAAMAFAIFAHAQSAKKSSSSGGAKEKLIGAWRIVLKLG
jgi:hypothetical protein